MQVINYNGQFDGHVMQGIPFFFFFNYSSAHTVNPYKTITKLERTAATKDGKKEKKEACEA